MTAWHRALRRRLRADACLARREAEEFEWYQSYDNIKDKIKAAFPDSNGKIINLGSGSSRKSRARRPCCPVAPRATVSFRSRRCDAAPAGHDTASTAVGLLQQRQRRLCLTTVATVVGLPVSMYLDGYKNITSVDFSKVSIDMMQGKFADKAELEWKVCCRPLPPSHAYIVPHAQREATWIAGAPARRASQKPAGCA